ncbi:MAG: hypothetical protein HZA89_03160 [Verrucomicrobia bacterium]|nr:hypothetical protein [Verrucomicrobiota bacterium]
MSAPPECPPRRLRPRPRVLLALAVIAGSLPLFLWPVRFAVDAAFWERLMDAAHLPFFAGVTLVFFTLLGGGKIYSLRPAALAALATTALAAFIEWLQPHFGRTESVEDFRNGVFGIVIAAGALTLFSFKKGKWPWLVLGAGAAALICVATQPAWQEWRGLVWRQNNFPLLGDFESETELHLWRPQGGAAKSPSTASLAAGHATHGGKSLHVKAGAGSWAGVSYSAGDKDWSGRRALAWSVFNPGAAFTLSLRIDDDGDCERAGQRYTDGFTVKPGWNHFQVPLADIEHGPRTRKLNLKAIRRAAFFTGEREPAREFFLDYVRLE